MDAENGWRYDVAALLVSGSERGSGRGVRQPRDPIRTKGDDVGENGAGLVFGMIQTPERPEDEADLNRWYDEEHLAEQLACPGVLSARRFVAIAGEPKYLATYDLESPAVLESPEYRRIAESPTAWTTHIHSYATIGKHNVYREITPASLEPKPGGPTGSGLFIQMLDVDPEHEDELNEWSNTEHLPDRLSLPGFLRARRFVATVGDPKYLVIYDLESPDALSTPEYKEMQGSPSERTKRMVAVAQNLVRMTYNDITPKLDS